MPGCLSDGWRKNLNAAAGESLFIRQLNHDFASEQMKIYTLKRNQTLPIPPERAWEFFSSPENLSRITPAKMNFKITSMSGSERMYPGQIISYKVTVLPFMRLRWVT
ncbi:MAG TPA: hypothetical protein VG737_11750, partial [Cyclobacteriaceae bacterium]|nr:hypothetical protein [Cyclobacteriaceae bacterium]